MKFQVGDKVQHPKMLDWGLGKVLELTPDGKARVFFINSGEKLLGLKFVSLEKVKGADAEHPILDNPTFHERATKKGHRGLPDARLDFIKLFPAGFDDNEYLGEERNYKIAARELLLELLNENEYATLLESGDYDEIVKRALQVANKTNLIFPNEKMGLKDGLKTPESVQLFAEQLYGLLYGKDEYRILFEAFAD